MIALIAILAAVQLGGGFGEGSASTVSLEEDSVLVELRVEVNVSAQSVVAHLSAADEEPRVLALIHRGGSVFGIRTELPRKDYLVVFEAIGTPGELSQPANLTTLGAELSFPSPTPTGEGGEPAEKPSQASRWGWLALALGAASLSLLAFWVLGGGDAKEGEEGEA
jgi:hypothetical protein